MVAGFSVMSSLLVILGIFAIFYTNRMQKNNHKILEENVASLKAAEELEIALLDMKGLTSNYLLDGQETWLETFDQKKSSFIAWFNKAEIKTHTPDEEILLGNIYSLFQIYLSNQKQVVHFYQTKNNEKANTILANQMRTAFEQIYEKCEQLITISENLMQQASQSIRQDNNTVNIVMYGICILGVLGGLGLGLALSRSITHPIYNLVLQLKSATSGSIIEQVDVRDLTELENLDQHIKKLIEKIRAMNKDLENHQTMLIRSEKLAALGKMTAGLAHELRNPLTAIKMLVYSLQNEIDSRSAAGEDCAIIIKEIHRMEKFLQDFLDFARPPKPNFSWNDVNEIVEQTIGLIAPQLRAAKISLKHLCSEPITVYTDKEQIKQVLINLFLNAIQSMPNGGDMQIAAERKNEIAGEKESVEITISDTGKGIPPETIEMIFDPFFTGREDGTGLGLSIASQIISNLGGWIKAMNNPEKGSCFIIDLPETRKPDA